MGKIYLIIKEDNFYFKDVIIGYTTSEEEAEKIVFNKNHTLRTTNEIYYYKEVNEIVMF